MALLKYHYTVIIMKHAARHIHKNVWPMHTFEHLCNCLAGVNVFFFAAASEVSYIVSLFNMHTDCISISYAWNSHAHKNTVTVQSYFLLIIFPFLQKVTFISVYTIKYGIICPLHRPRQKVTTALTLFLFSCQPSIHYQKRKKIIFDMCTCLSFSLHLKYKSSSAENT